MTLVEGWTLVVPIKRLDQAKSRLALPSDARAALALAMALDTVDAVLGATSVARLVIVTSEEQVRTALDGMPRVQWLDDPDAGLAGAIARGQDHLSVSATGTGPSAILLGDLPALRPAELDAGLAAARGHQRAMVPDAEGTGTTLLTAGRAQDLRPQFGHGSRAAHEAAGHRVLDQAGPGLRRDVDTAADLAQAIRLGVGRATADVLAGLTVQLGVPPGERAAGSTTAERT